MIVYDDLLSPEVADSIEQSLLQLPWYFQSVTSDLTGLGNAYQRSDPNIIESPYLVNLLGCHDHGTSANDIKPFICIIKELEERTGRSFLPRVQRIKANLYLKRIDYPNDCYQLPHVDMWDASKRCADPGEIFLYYADDSDGDTFFFNEEFGSKEYTVSSRSAPRKGKGVLFDNTQVHASSPPRMFEKRITLNFVFAK